MPAIPVAINRLATFLVPQATGESVPFISGAIKVIARYGPGGKAFARDTAMFLTRAEQSALFRFGLRGLVWVGARVFLLGAILDFAANLLGFKDEKKTLATRLEIIEAHVLKGGPLWSRAIGAGEQVLFILLDAAGDTLSDALAGTVANFDDPQTIPAELGRFTQHHYYSELLSPVDDLDKVDSIFEAPGFILQPALLPFPAEPGLTFPAGPMPSWGRRS